MSCFFFGCKTGYKSEKRKNKELGVKNPSLFKALTKDMLNNWQNALSRPGKLFTENDRVCSRHFTPDQIETEYVTVMPDGTVNRIPKGRPTLKSIAIPSTLLESTTLSMSNEKYVQNRTSLFEVDDYSAQKRVKNDPDTHQVECELTCEEMMTDQTADFNEGDLGESVSQYKTECSIPKGRPTATLKSTATPSTLLESTTLSMSNEKYAQKFTSPFEVEDYSAQKRVKNGADTHEVECELTCEETMAMDQIADFKGDLGESVSQDKIEWRTESFLESFWSIPVPSPFWTSNVVNDNVMFTCWAENLDTVVKRVVVRQDLSLRIFISEKEITIPGLQSVESVKYIAGILATISNILPCKGVDNKEHANDCFGYVHRKKQNQTGRQSTRCLPCKKMLKSWSKKKPMQLLQEKRKNYKLRRSHENLKRRNNTLKQKNAKLRQKLKEMQAKCSKAKTEAVQAAISHLP